MASDIVDLAMGLIYNLVSFHQRNLVPALCSGNGHGLSGGMGTIERNLLHDKIYQKSFKLLLSPGHF